MGSKYTKRYTEEFKRDAIALVDSSGKTVTAVARELGISSESLRGWYRRARAPLTRRTASSPGTPWPQALLGSDLARGTTNLARRRFLGQGQLYESSSTEEFGHIVVARLRRAADRYPHDPQVTALLAELHADSEEFRQIWQTRPVHAPGHRTKILDHPEAGTLRLNCDVLPVPEDDQEVVLITADSDHLPCGPCTGWPGRRPEAEDARRFPQRPQNVATTCPRTRRLGPPDLPETRG